MKKTIRKSLALLLAVLMLVSVSPMSFADMYPCPNCGEKTEMVSIDEQPATCLLPGRESGLFCTKCKQFVFGGEVIPITDHDYQSYAGETAYCSGSAEKDLYQCSVCKALFLQTIGEDEKPEYESVEAAALSAHDLPEQPTAAVPAQCGVEGSVAYYRCSKCNKTFADSEGKEELKTVIVDALEHSLQHIERKEATCQEDGNIEYWYCTLCESSFSDSEAKTLIPVTDEEDPRIIVSPNVDHQPAGDWVKVGKDGEDFDCEVGGTKVKYCSVCQGIAIEEPFNPGSHSVDQNWKYESATGGAFVCADGGKRYKECTVCGKRTSEEEVHPSPEQHDWVTVDAVKATCGKPGHNEFDRCQRCGLEKGRVDEPALQHEWTHVDAVEKKCNLEGVKEHYYCKNCGKYSWTDGGLDLIEDIKDESGKVIKTVQEQISDGKGDHTLKSYVDPKDASCIRAGRKEVFKCEVCGQLVVAADQKQDGNYEDGAYKINGVYYKDIAAVTEANTPALGHYWFDDMEQGSVGYVPAKCNKEGSHIKVCLRCSTKETVTDPALPHVKGDPVLGPDGNPVVGPATCTEPAYEKYICKECGEEYKEFSTEEPSGHDWSSELTVARPATCTEKGAHGYKCNNCDEYTGLVEDIDALGHDLTVESEAATCVKAGFTHTTCSRCDLDETVEIPATGEHVDANNDGYCDNCNTYTTCSHICHKKDPFSQFIWFIMNVWNQFLGINQICTECGAKHYEKAINIVVPD